MTTKTHGPNLINLGLAIVVVYAIYTSSNNDKTEPIPVGLEHPAASVPGRLATYSAAAYKEAIETLKDTDTEGSFNERLRAIQGRATALSYAPLDDFLQQTFNGPDGGSQESTWSPAKAREVYGKIQTSLEEVGSKMAKAGLLPKN